MTNKTFKKHHLRKKGLNKKFTSKNRNKDEIDGGEGRIKDAFQKFASSASKAASTAKRKIITATTDKNKRAKELSKKIEENFQGYETEKKKIEKAISTLKPSSSSSFMTKDDILNQDNQELKTNLIRSCNTIISSSKEALNFLKNIYYDGLEIKKLGDVGSGFTEEAGTAFDNAMNKINSINILDKSNLIDILSGIEGYNDAKQLAIDTIKGAKDDNTIMAFINKDRGMKTAFNYSFDIIRNSILGKLSAIGTSTRGTVASTSGEDSNDESNVNSDNESVQASTTSTSSAEAPASAASTTSRFSFVKQAFTGKDSKMFEQITALPNITTGMFAVKFVDETNIQLGFCPIGETDYNNAKTAGFTKVGNYLLRDNELVKAIKENPKSIFLIMYDITSGKPEIYFSTYGGNNDLFESVQPYKLDESRSQILNDVITIAKYTDIETELPSDKLQKVLSLTYTSKDNITAPAPKAEEEEKEDE